MASTNELTIVKPNGETLVVDASKFRAKPMNLVRDIVAEWAYDEYLGDDVRDSIDSDDVLNALLEDVANIQTMSGSAPKYALQLLAKVSEQDALVDIAENALEDDAREAANAKLPKKTERVRFERDLGRYQPTKSRASKYAGQTRSQLKVRISELELHIEALASAMVEAGLDVPPMPEFTPTTNDDAGDDAGDDN